MLVSDYQDLMKYRKYYIFDHEKEWEIKPVNNKKIGE